MALEMEAVWGDRPLRNWCGVRDAPSAGGAGRGEKMRATFSSNLEG